MYAGEIKLLAKAAFIRSRERDLPQVLPAGDKRHNTVDRKREMYSISNFDVERQASN